MHAHKFIKSRSLLFAKDMIFGKQKFDVLKINNFMFNVKQLKMNKFKKYIWQLVISTSNYALEVPALLPCICTTIFLCSLFLISTDLRMPLVSHGLFNSFFCVFDTFWRGAQKFINFCTFLRYSSEGKSTSLWLKISSVIQSTFPNRELIKFFNFFNLLEDSKHFL